MGQKAFVMMFTFSILSVFSIESAIRSDDARLCLLVAIFAFSAGVFASTTFRYLKS